MENAVRGAVLEWSVVIRGGDEELFEVAEVDTEPRARLFTDALKLAGVDAIYFRKEIQF